MLDPEKFISVSRDQKESIGLLQVGTFLEYFDLMLYVHMAVVLNELFFPKTDPHTASLLAAFAFCSTFVMRPIGALIFGYIGDTIGRKATIIITTIMMSISCIIMANLPTYAQIGITASWIVTICRMMQGMSSMGEILGAEIYITESVKPPFQCPFVSLLDCASILGGVFALGVATLCMTHGFNWRTAFWIGAAIALVGSVARTRLRETPEFVNMKKRVERGYEAMHGPEETKKFMEESKKRHPLPNKKMILHFLMIEFSNPVFFFVTYIYISLMLKNQFGFTPEQIIHHNLFICLLVLLNVSVSTLLSYKIDPFKILKVKLFITCVIILCIPYIFSKNCYEYVFFIQILFALFQFTITPAAPLVYNKFPVMHRFKFTAIPWAIARAIGYCGTSVGIIYLTEWFSHYGLWVVMVPVSVSFFIGIRYFEKLDIYFKTYEPNKNFNLR